MQGNHSRDTKPELALRHALHALGYRYRVHVPPTRSHRRRADIAFARHRLAVFVDGCFWHGCPDHYLAPSAHGEYWADKIRRNRERDRLTDEEWRAAGWRVLRLWEHLPRHEQVRRVIAALGEARESVTT
jgi:DNA mismatch endonuclease (patch repair protein)